MKDNSIFTRLTTPNRLVIASWLMVLTSTPAVAAFKPVALRCEYRVEPLGIDEAQPRLTWRIESDVRGARQTAYQLLVATDRKKLEKDEADLWDSGKVVSDETANIAYAGKPLGSRQQCFWKVRVWDQQDKPAKWSPAASWTIGLRRSEDWKASYISFKDNSPVHKDPNTLALPPAHQYRKEFALQKEVKRATIYATALGIYELHLNGKRVGDALFAPGWTDYHQRAYYNTYDATRLVKRGSNAIGAWVADGWYSGYLGFGLLTGVGTEKIGRYIYGRTPALMAQLEIEYADGTTETIGTDSTWKVTGAGPIQEADFLMGEYYDARKETPGWTTAGFDDRSWEQAIRAEDGGSVPATFYEFVNPKAGEEPSVKGRPVDLGFKRPPVLEAFPGMPVRVIEEIKPIAITSPTNGVYIFNLGQNFAGVARLKVKGPAGTTVRIRYGEMLYPDGRLMTENLRKARATDYYVLRGGRSTEVYTPRFTFHGFQYVELTGYPGKPGLDAVTGLVLHSDTPFASDFVCSDPVPNRLFQNIRWTQRANFVDLPTDCPQRDERFGWTGDAQVYVRAATYNADVAAFYTKWLRELMESQRPSGVFPGYAPFPFQHGWDFGTAWCDAGVICPWTIWQAYGDTRIIERCWEPMTRFLDWRKSTSKEWLGINHGNDWGDWLSFGGKTPLEYIDTAYFFLTSKMMAEMAHAVGKEKEAGLYRDWQQNVQTAFLKKYLRADGSLSVDTQTAYDLALFVGLIPKENQARAADILAAKIRSAATADNSGITTGFIGTRPLLPVLSAQGHHDLAGQLFQSRKFPSWGYEIEQGATTIWERWNSYTKDKGFGGEQNASMNSFAHYSFGAVGEWMFYRLAGIDTDTPGYKHIILRPTPQEPGSNPERPPIDWVKAHYDSLPGRIVSNWKLLHGVFEFQATIPANTTATVYLPAQSQDSLLENGKPIGSAKGVKFLRMEKDRAVLSVGSGTYRFTSKP
jgi:alpha-L-rhamnosidase